MTTEQRRLQLAADVERALAEYMGVSVFDAVEFPDLAQSFALLVAAANVTVAGGSPRDVAYNAQEFGHRLAEFAESIAKLVD